LYRARDPAPAAAATSRAPIVTRIRASMPSA
jgi:hypothetical protein